MAMTRNALLRSSLVGGRVGGVGDEAGLFVRRVGEMLRTRKSRLGEGKSGVAGAWVGMSRWGGGEFSPLRKNCCVGLRSGPTHDLFRCFPCTFGTLLVNSVLSLCIQYFPCAFLVLSLYTQCFSCTLLVCSTLWHFGGIMSWPREPKALSLAPRR